MSPCAGDLCCRCGLCCDGSLFSHAPLRAGEADRLLPLGVRVSRRDDRDRLLQGCTALGSDGCGVYEARPHACRLFKCLELHAFEEGEASLDEALATVAEGRELLGRLVLALPPAGDDPTDPRTRAARLHRPDDGAPLSPAALEAWDACHRFLERHFRGRL